MANAPSPTSSSGDPASRGGTSRTPARATPASPFAFLRRFAEDVDRLFEEFSLGPQLGAPRVAGSSGEWMPAIEVDERDGMLVVRAELPGVKREDIHVDVDDGVLTISGERREERREESHGWLHSERRYGRFCRTIALPEGVDADACHAEFRDGVLDVRVPLPKARAGTHRIEIHEAGSTGAVPTTSTGGETPAGTTRPGTPSPREGDPHAGQATG